MTLSRANTVLTIWIILVGIASFGNAESTIKDDLLKNATQIKLLAESTRDQLQNDPKNKKSNGTIAEQFGLIAQQVDSLVELIKPISLDGNEMDDDQITIQSFAKQLEGLKTLLDELFDQYSHEASKQRKLITLCNKLKDIVNDYSEYYHKKDLKTIENQYETLLSKLYSISYFLDPEESPIYEVYTMKVLDVIETEVAQINDSFKLLSEKYPKP